MYNLKVKVDMLKDKIADEVTENTEHLCKGNVLELSVELDKLINEYIRKYCLGRVGLGS